MCASDVIRSVCAAGRGVVLGVLMTTLAGTVAAQSAADRDKEQIRRLRQQVQQLQQEQATLQASVQAAQAQAAKDKSSAEEAVKAAQGESKALGAASRKKTAALSAEIATLQQDKAQLGEQLMQMQKQLDEQKNQALAQKSSSDRQLAEWQAKHQQLSQQMDQCRTQNADLYLLGTDLLQRYGQLGWTDKLARNEPFFQFARVKLENAQAELADKLEAARLKSARPETPSQPEAGQR